MPDAYTLRSEARFGSCLRVRDRAGNSLSLLDVLVVLLVAIAMCASADAAGGQEIRTYQRLEPAQARSEAVFSQISHVRELRDGGVMVADSGGRWVALMDPALATSSVIVENNPFGNSGRGRGLIPWRGDSTLLIDLPNRAALVVDAFGDIRREIAIPTVQLAQCLLGGDTGTPTVDASGRVICQMPLASVNASGSSRSNWVGLQVADSSPLIRVDIASWAIDTVALLRTPRIRLVVLDYGEGRYASAPVLVPLHVADDWARLDDGTLAIVRGADYRVDRITLDGAQLTSALLPFLAQPLTAARKTAMLDSMRAALAALRAAHAPAGALDPPWRIVTGTVDHTQIRAMTIVLPNAARDPAFMAARRARELSPLVIGTPEDLPDFVPPFRPGSVRADGEGHLWIPTLQVVDGSVVYDVVRAADMRLTHVLVPAGQTIVGFGAGGAVYLASGEPGAMRLERARIPFER